jgi:hypothetical protein
MWGAAVGTWSVAQALASSSDGTAAVGAMLTLVLIYYTLAGVSALFVLRGRQRAVPYLAAAQLPQIIVLQTAHFQYHLLSGLYLLVTGGSWVGVQAGVMSTFVIQSRVAGSWIVGVNVVATAVLWYLLSPAARRAVEARQFPLRALDQLGGGEVSVESGEPPNKRLEPTRRKIKE